MDCWIHHKVQATQGRLVRASLNTHLLSHCMGGRTRGDPPVFNSQICIILVKPKHDGNIGAVARTMLNFGVTELRIVNRSIDWSDEVRKRAKNAQTVLDETTVYETLDQSIADCSLVVGTSGKREDGKKTAMRHFLTPEELPLMLQEANGKVALVFGPEGKGLLNDQLRVCDLLVTIPTWEGYPILNLSHAVSIICYSWFNDSMDKKPKGAEERLLSPDLRKKLRDEISRLASVFPTQSHKRRGIEETMVRVIMRGLPKEDEIHRILSVFSKSADSFVK